MSEDWKIDMLRNLWSGEDSDPNKQDNVKKSKKQSSNKISTWSEIDLHKYHNLSKQLEVAERAIDQAILSNKNGIKIIHGKGQGILRSQLIKILKKHPQISSYKSIKDQYNESGAINVKFKD